MPVLMKGLDVVNSIKENLLTEVSNLKTEGIVPGLAIVRLGSKPDDISYERGAIKRCESVGINCTVFEFSETISQIDLTNEIAKISKMSDIHGVLIFRPLPKHIDENIIKYAIDPKKDIDCLSPYNIAKVFEGDESGFAPCTPQAVIDILDYYRISIEGKNIVILGRSLVVGKPLSMMLLKRNATVTICHTKTKNLKEICRNAEIIIAAVGKAKILTEEYVSEGTIVIDVGINMDDSGNLCGDVDFESVSKSASYITPVPGGVGTVTTSVLAKHVIRSASNRQNNE